MGAFVLLVFKYFEWNSEYNVLCNCKLSMLIITHWLRWDFWKELKCDQLIYLKTVLLRPSPRKLIITVFCHGQLLELEEETKTNNKSMKLTLWADVNIIKLSRLIRLIGDGVINSHSFFFCCSSWLLCDKSRNIVVSINWIAHTRNR